MRWRSTERARAARRHRLSVEQRQLVWAVVSRVLDYPDEALLESLPALRAAAEPLPAGFAEPLGEVLAGIGDTPLAELQARYVRTFDHTRRCALYLTYFAYGDTRRRGVALVQFKQAYRRAGMEFDDTDAELPDHLCAVLQFGSTVDHDTAWQLLLDHRAGVEMLRLALREDEAGSGALWAPALTALCDTLPPLGGAESEAIRKLIADGPPGEEVGLAPYALVPSLAEPSPMGPGRPGPSRPEFVGMPTGRER